MAASAYGLGYVASGIWLLSASCIALASKVYGLVCFVLVGPLWFICNELLRRGITRRTSSSRKKNAAPVRNAVFVLEAVLPCVLALGAREVNASLGGGALSLAVVLSGLGATALLALAVATHRSEVERGVGLLVACFYGYRLFGVKVVLVSLLLGVASIVWGVRCWRRMLLRQQAQKNAE